MTTPLARLAMAGALVLVTTGGGAFGALAATGPDPVQPKHFSGQSQRTVTSPFAKTGGISPDGKAPDASVSADALTTTGEVTEMATACPLGRSSARSTTSRASRPDCRSTPSRSARG